MYIRKLHSLSPVLRTEENPEGAGGGGTPSGDDTGQSNAINTPKDFALLVDADMNLTEGYQAMVGEHAEGTNFKNLGDVFKSVKEGQRMISRLTEEKGTLSKQLEDLNGKPPVEIPDNVDDYRKALTLPEAMPEGLELDEQVLAAATEFAMEKGYSPEQLSDFLAFDVKRAQMALDAQANAKQGQADEAIERIRELVGPQNYDMTIANAKFAVQTLGLPIKEDDLLASPEMVVSLAKIRNQLGEGTLKDANINGVNISNGSKLEQANAIISDTENPLYTAFHDPSHAQHDYAQQEHARLIAESVQ